VEKTPIWGIDEEEAGLILHARIGTSSRLFFDNRLIVYKEDKRMKTRNNSHSFKHVGRPVITARRLVLVLLTLIAMVSSAVARDDGRGDRNNRFAATLSGYNEVHFIAGDPTSTPLIPPALRGAISTAASGKFSATLNKAGDVIDYELSYEALQGDVTQAHIHFGQRHTVGGIVVWLCQTQGTQAPEAVRDEKITPICPQEGTVKGTITAGQVLAPTAQGIDVGEFEELVRAIRAGAAYPNVHSALFTPGEIRGQIRETDRR
jgi:hypothetical protein